MIKTVEQYGRIYTCFIEIMTDGKQKPSNKINMLHLNN